MHTGDAARHAQFAGEGERRHKQEVPAVTRYTRVAHANAVNVEPHLSDDRTDSIPILSLGSITRYQRRIAQAAHRLHRERLHDLPRFQRCGRLRCLDDLHRRGVLQADERPAVCHAYSQALGAAVPSRGTLPIEQIALIDRSARHFYLPALAVGLCPVYRRSGEAPFAESHFICQCDRLCAGRVKRALVRCLVGV